MVTIGSIINGNVTNVMDEIYSITLTVSMWRTIQGEFEGDNDNGIYALIGDAIEGKDFCDIIPVTFTNAQYLDILDIDDFDPDDM